MTELLESLVVLDYLGIALFAVSGALVAAEKRHNLVTFAFFAVATAVGGGTIRDLLIDAPVFWVHQNTPMVVCLGAALLVWFLAKAHHAAKAIVWFDALGLVAYAVYGTEKALRHEIAPVPACLMGVMTACAGGIIRDLLAQQPSILLRPEVYVTAAAVSAATYAALLPFVAPWVAALVAVALGFLLRALAITRGLSLPPYRR